MKKEDSCYYGIFSPKSDITSYELARLIPFLVPNGSPLTQSAVASLNSAARHFILFTNENELKKYIENETANHKHDS